VIANAAAMLLIAAGAFFLLVSAVGLLRLPDFLSRTHAVGKSETLGSLLVLSGLAVHHGLALESAKLFLILFFVAATNPVGIHTLTRAALRRGDTPWDHPVDLSEASREASRQGAEEASP